MAKEVGQRVIIAFDFGTQSIGVAIGNEISWTAQALAALKAKDGIPDSNALDKYFNDWQPDAIVVGLPLNMDGTYQEVTFKAKKFGNRLSNKFRIPVYFKDERLTTKSAREELFATGGYKNLTKGKVDSQSAVVILEGFWEENFQ